MLRFIIVGYVWQILGRRSLFCRPTIREQLRKGPSWIGVHKTISIHIYSIFYEQYFTFIRNARLKLAKNQANAKQHPEAELLLFEKYSLSLLRLSSKNNRRYSKKCTKNKYLCLNVVIWLMTMKRPLKLKIKSHRYDINRPRSRHGQKHTKYKMCLSKMMVICIKQDLSNIWSSIHEKVKLHWGWIEKVKSQALHLANICNVHILYRYWWLVLGNILKSCGFYRFTLNRNVIPFYFIFIKKCFFTQSVT